MDNYPTTREPTLMTQEPTRVMHQRTTTVCTHPGMRPRMFMVASLMTANRESLGVHQRENGWTEKYVRATAGQQED